MDLSRPPYLRYAAASNSISSFIVIVAAVTGTLLGLILLAIAGWIWHKQGNDVDLLPDNIIRGMPPNEADPGPPNVLILYRPTNDFHKQVVQNVANFIQTHCKCKVTLDDSTTVITDAFAWVIENLENADKVIFIWHQDNQECNLVLNNQDDTFSLGYRQMIESCKTTDNSNYKWIVARMKYTKETDVLDDSRPDSVPLFELHGQIADLCSYLYNHRNDDGLADDDVARLDLQTQLWDLLNDVTDCEYATAVLINGSFTSGESHFTNSEFHGNSMAGEGVHAEQNEYNNPFENERKRKQEQFCTTNNASEYTGPQINVSELQNFEAQAVASSHSYEHIPLIIQCEELMMARQPSYFRHNGELQMLNRL